MDRSRYENAYLDPRDDDYYRQKGRAIAQEKQLLSELAVISDPRIRQQLKREVLFLKDCRAKHKHEQECRENAAKSLQQLKKHLSALVAKKTFGR